MSYKKAETHAETLVRLHDTMELLSRAYVSNNENANTISELRRTRDEHKQQLANLLFDVEHLKNALNSARVSADREHAEAQRIKKALTKERDTLHKVNAELQDNAGKDELIIRDLTKEVAAEREAAKRSQHAIISLRKDYSYASRRFQADIHAMEKTLQSVKAESDKLRGTKERLVFVGATASYNAMQLLDRAIKDLCESRDVLRNIPRGQPINRPVCQVYTDYDTDTETDNDTDNDN